MPRFADAHALIAGVADYRPDLRPLSEAVLRDAEAVHAALVDPAVGAYDPGKRPAPSERPRWPRFASIRPGRPAPVADDRSTVLIYFSGHGGRLEIGRGGRLPSAHRRRLSRRGRPGGVRPLRPPTSRTPCGPSAPATASSFSTAVTPAASARPRTSRAACPRPPSNVSKPVSAGSSSPPRAGRSCPGSSLATSTVSSPSTCWPDCAAACPRPTVWCASSTSSITSSRASPPSSRISIRCSRPRSRRTSPSLYAWAARQLAPPAAPPGRRLSLRRLPQLSRPRAGQELGRARRCCPGSKPTASAPASTTATSGSAGRASRRRSRPCRRAGSPSPS